MKLILGILLVFILQPSLVFAETWQEWSQDNPTYQSKPQPSTPTPSVPSVPESSPVTSLEFEMQVFRASFLNACKRGVPAAFCQCTLEGLEAEFTPQELLSQDPFLDQDISVESRTQPIYEACFERAYL